MRFLSSFRRLLEKLRPWRRSAALVGVFLFVVGLGLLGVAHFSLAAGDPPSATATATAAVDSSFGAFVLFLANILQTITGYIGQLALGIIEMIVVPILQYNGFSSSPTIGLGWSLVRDVVNMFVVLVLLVIAIATIVGYEKVHWQKNLPQFLLAVILVNFSRTICGILIDISQVVMFTFVNALLDVAAGNFASLLNFDNYGLYSNSAVVDAATGTSKAIDAGQQLGAAYLLFVLYASMFAILLLLALVFIWRIILLWVLVILSPLTFFTWGLGGMFKFAAGTSGDWWKKFTGALTLGPMLTFFLWLALSTGSGDIVSDEGFPPTDSALSPVLVSFETSNLLGTFLGLVLLIVGMQQSAATASSLGGWAKSLMGNEKTGQNIVKGAIGWTGGYTAKREAAQTAKKWSGYGIAAGQQIGTSVPLVGGAIGRGVIGASGFVQQKASANIKEGRESAEKRLKAMTDDQKAANLALVAAGRGAVGASARDDIDAMKMEFAMSPALRKKAEKTLTPEEYNNLSKGALEYANSKKDSFDDGQKSKFNKFKSERANQLDEALGDGELVKHIQDAAFNPRELSKAALADPKVIDALKKRIVKTTDAGDAINAYDEMVRGAYGEDLKSAARAGAAPKVTNPTALKPEVRNADDQVVEPARPYTSQELASSINNKSLDINSLAPSAYQGPNGPALVSAVIDTKSIEKMSAAQRQDFAGAINSLPKGQVSITQRAQADTQLMANGVGPVEAGLIPADASTGGTLTPDMHMRVEQVITTDTAAVRYLQPGLPSNPDTPNDVTSTIVNRLSADDIKKLGERAAKASGQELADIRQSLATIGAALRAEKVTAIVDPNVDKKLKTLDRAHRAASRYVA